MEGAIEGVDGARDNHRGQALIEKEGADGEHLFVVVYAKDRLLGAHAVSLLPDATLWWLAADRASGGVCWFAGAPSGGVQKIAPWPSRYGPSVRDGSSAPGERKRKSEALPSAPPGTRSICPTSEAAEPRGAREALCHGRLPRGSGRQEIALLRIQ